MKRSAIAATAALMVVLLAGCSAPAAETSVESAAPLVAESPVAAPLGQNESAYLAAVRDALPANTQIPNATDEQLVAAGELACEELAAGADTGTLSVIEGEKDNGYGAYLDSGAIISTARSTLCG